MAEIMSVLEDIKKELTSAADITDAPGAKTELREGDVETKSDEDKGEEDSREQRVKDTERPGSGMRIVGGTGGTPPEPIARK
jgi:hypothetical protein